MPDVRRPDMSPVRSSLSAITPTHAPDVTASHGRLRRRAPLACSLDSAACSRLPSYGIAFRDRRRCAIRRAVTTTRFRSTATLAGPLSRVRHRPMARHLISALQPSRSRSSSAGHPRRRTAVGVIYDTLLTFRLMRPIRESSRGSPSLSPGLRSDRPPRAAVPPSTAAPPRHTSTRGLTPACSGLATLAADARR